MKYQTFTKFFYQDLSIKQKTLCLMSASGEKRQRIVFFMMLQDNGNGFHPINPYIKSCLSCITLKSRRHNVDNCGRSGDLLCISVDDRECENYNELQMNLFLFFFSLKGCFHSKNKSMVHTSACFYGGWQSCHPNVSFL